MGGHLENVKPVGIRVPPRYSEVGRWRRLPAALAALAVAGGAAVLFLFNPSESGFYPFCLFHRTTGLLCPGCGGLRAMHQLLHGHLLAALRFNALFIVSLPLLGWWMARYAAAKLRHRPASLAVRPVWFWLGLAALVLFGILRNLPFARAAWLAP